jgi:hypothetical protein
MDENQYTPATFVLSCNFWKIYKYVPQISSILFNSYYSTNLDGSRNHDELTELLNSPDIESDETLNKKEQIHYMSSHHFNKGEVDNFIELFRSILKQQRFSKYNLISEADNLLLLMLFLYDSYWDHSKSWYNTHNAFIVIPQLESEDMPTEYYEMVKAKELAKFLKNYYFNDLYFTNGKQMTSTIGLIRGQSHALIKDQRMNAYLTSLIINGLMESHKNITALSEIFGHMGLVLLANLKPVYNEKQKQTLVSQIDYVLNFDLENPFPQRNKDISFMFFLLRAYLSGAEIIGNNKKLLHNDQIRLYTELLNLFEVKFSDKHYETEDYRKNLSKTIRQYFIDNKHK